MAKSRRKNSELAALCNPVEGDNPEDPNEIAVDHLYENHHFDSLRKLSISKISTNSFQDEFQDFKVMFQGKEMLLDCIFSIKSMNSAEIISLKKQLMKKQSVDIGNDVKFNELEVFIDRKFLPLNFNPLNDPRESETEDFEFNEYSFDEVIKFAEIHKTILLIDEPGMGRTTSLKKFALGSKVKFDSRWILFIDLKKYYKTYEKELETSKKFSNFEEVARFLYRKILKLESFEAKIFLRLLRTDRVILLVDGFDEICSKYRHFIINMLIIVRSKSKNQLWITTRPNLKKALKKAFKPLAFQLKPFNDQNVNDYLTTRFQCNGFETETIRKKLDNAQIIFKRLKQLNWSGHDAPLLSRVIADVLIDTETVEPKTNIYNIYDAFTNQTFTKCKNVDISGIVGFCRQRAFLTVFNKEITSKVFKELPVIPTDSLNILYFDGENYHFTNRSFAEFFIAQHIHESIFIQTSAVESEALVEALAEILTNDQHKSIKTFVECALSTIACSKVSEPLKPVKLVEKILSKSRYHHVLHCMVDCGNLNTIKVISCLLENPKKLWRVKTSSKNISANKNNLMMTAIDRQPSISFMTELWSFAAELLDTKCLASYFLDTNGSDRNILQFSASKSLDIFIFFLEKAVEVLSEKEMKETLLSLDKDGNRIFDCTPELRFQSDSQNIFQVVKNKITNTCFENVLLSLGPDIFKYDVIKEICEILKEFLVEPKKLKEFFFTTNTKKESVIQYIARQFNIHNFKTAWSFMSSELSDELQNEILLNDDNNRLKALHYAIDNDDNRTFHFMKNIYQDKLGSDKVREIILEKLCRQRKVVDVKDSQEIPPKTIQILQTIRGSFKKFPFTKVEDKKVAYENMLIGNNKNALLLAAKKLSKDVFEHLWNSAIIEFLQSKKSKKDFLLKRFSDGATIFHHAVRNCDEETFNFVKVVYKENFSKTELIEIISSSDNCGNIFNYALKYKCGSLDALLGYTSRLLKKDMLRDLMLSADNNDKSILMSAAEKTSFDDLNIFWKWIEKSFDLKAQKKILLLEDKFGLTAFHYARNNNRSFNLLVNVHLHVLTNDEMKEIILGQKKGRNILFILSRWNAVGRNFEDLWKFILELYKDDKISLKKALLQKYRTGETVFTKAKICKLDKICDVLSIYAEKNFTKSEIKEFYRSK